jgi:hypothetical protein
VLFYVTVEYGASSKCDSVLNVLQTLIRPTTLKKDLTWFFGEDHLNHPLLRLPIPMACFSSTMVSAVKIGAATALRAC